MCVIGDSQSSQVDNQNQPYKSLSENTLSYDLHEDDVIVMINQKELLSISSACTRPQE